jgi:hypothetical protein
MAIEIIGHHSQGLALRGVVLKALGDHSDYVVRTACEAVARWELIEAHERVVALLANASAVTGRLLFARWMLFGSTRIFGMPRGLLGRHWLDGRPFIVREFVAHDSPLTTRRA